jgi:hypothetical protein
MNDPAQLRFDYGALDADTRQFVLERTERIHNLARMTATGIVQIGQYLTEVKARLKHGQFLDWIEREFAWSEPSAQRFMRVHERFKSVNLTDMTIDVSALYLIAAPSTPEPVRGEALRRAEAGEVITHGGARALVRRFQQTGELPESTISLPRLIDERRALIAPSGGNRFANLRPPVEDPARLAAEARQREQVKANTERAVKVFHVIEAIECLSGTPLAVQEIAAEIRRLDTPDKDWPRQLRHARRFLAALSEELQ